MQPLIKIQCQVLVSFELSNGYVYTDYFSVFLDYSNVEQEAANFIQQQISILKPQLEQAFGL
jgi:hypothetical protein